MKKSSNCFEEEYMKKKRDKSHVNEYQHNIYGERLSLSTAMYDIVSQGVIMQSIAIE
jgi:hypothetical protein